MPATVAAKSIALHKSSFMNRKDALKAGVLGDLCLMKGHWPYCVLDLPELTLQLSYVAE